MGRPDDWIPQETDTEGPWQKWAIPGAPSTRTMLGEDMTWIATHADGIAMMPGWEHSRGAMVEHMLAVALGLEIKYLIAS